MSSRLQVSQLFQSRVFRSVSRRARSVWPSWFDAVVGTGEGLKLEADDVEVEIRVGLGSTLAEGVISFQGGRSEDFVRTINIR